MFHNEDQSGTIDLFVLSLIDKQFGKCLYDILGQSVLLFVLLTFYLHLQVDLNRLFLVKIKKYKRLIDIQYCIWSATINGSNGVNSNV